MTCVWVFASNDRSADLVDPEGTRIGGIFRNGGRWDAWAARGKVLRGRGPTLDLGGFATEFYARRAVEEALKRVGGRIDWAAVAKAPGAHLSQSYTVDENAEHRLGKADLL